MTDLEKVIHDLPICIDFAESRGYSGLVDVMRDALALLKARETKPPRFAIAYDKIFYACDNCGKSLVVMANSEGLVLQQFLPKYCNECGQAVKGE